MKGDLFEMVGGALDSFAPKFAGAAAIAVAAKIGESKMPTFSRKLSEIDRNLELNAEGEAAFFALDGLEKRDHVAEELSGKLIIRGKYLANSVAEVEVEAIVASTTMSRDEAEAVAEQLALEILGVLSPDVEQEES